MADYLFQAFFHKAKIGATPANAPTIDVINVLTGALVVTAQPAVALANMVGLYKYEYSGAAGNGLLNGLVAYWGLDEAAGANDALDKHTGGLTLTQVSSPGSAAGKVYAGARTFDGAADYFTRPSEAALQTGDVDFAVAAWVYAGALTFYRIIVSKFSAVGGQREWNIYYDKDLTKFIFQASGDGTASSYVAATIPSPASLTTWYFVQAWHDAGANTISLQIDNGTVYSAAHTTGIFASTSALMVGFYPGGNAGSYWNGRLGPVAFWKNRTLDAAARAALWANGNGLPYASFTT